MKSMKNILGLIFILSVNLFAQFKFDTLSVKEIASGAYHYHIQEKNVPWNINFLKIDLRNPNIKIKTVKAEDKLIARETTSSMAARSSSDSVLVVGAINSDFFDGVGIPVGAQVSDGELISSSVAPSWTKIGFDKFNNPMVGRINFSGEVIAGQNKNILNAVNQERAADFMVLYNSFYGASTKTNEWGTEISLRPITSWIVDDTVKLEVTNKFSRTGNAQIGNGEVILSAHGSAETFINNFIQIGDTIKLVVRLNSGLKYLWQMVSGFPVILKNGSNYALKGYAEEGGSATFATDRHPRTAAGISVDSNYLFLAVVDGRQTISKGMSLPEFADFFIRIGAYNAVNLDGGGSSTILARNKIVNFPSDGTERKVSNCLLVITKEKLELSELKIFPDSILLSTNQTVQFKLTAKDKYGYNENLTFKDVEYELTNPSFGRISDDGTFLPNAEGETYLIVRKGSISDTAKIMFQVGVGKKKLDGFEELLNWNLTGKEIDTVNSSLELSTDFFSEGSTSAKINYSYTYQSGKTYWVYLNNEFPIFGIPEKISLDVKSDGWNHNVAFVVTDENGEEFAFLTNKSASQTEFFDSLFATLKNPIKINPSSTFFYPITIKQIAITLANDRQVGKIYSGSIYLDNLRISYPELVGIEKNISAPLAFNLEQNFPNPFNPTTRIKFSVPSNSKSGNHNVKLTVYDILGRAVSTLVNENKPAGHYEIEFDGSKLSSGIYLYTLQSEDFLSIKKLVVLK